MKIFVSLSDILAIEMPSLSCKSSFFTYKLYTHLNNEKCTVLIKEKQ